MTELATLGLSIRSDGVVVATDRLKDFEGAGRRAEGVAGSLMRAAVTMGAALAGAFSIRAISQYADAWSDMQSRVGAAVKDMEAAPALMQRMVDLANASYSPLEQTVEVYTRNVGVLRDLGVSAAGAADFTESLNHMLVITATRGERAASVQNALSKAMATGRLQADGLETILSSGGRVAEALADELGTTVSGLRGMASQGLITGDVIKNALLNSLVDVREEAAKMPATIGDAFTRIQTNTTALVGTLDQAWGISGRVAEQMMTMANGIRGSADTMLRLGNIVGSVLGPAFDLLGANIDNIASLAGVAVAALAGFYAPTLISGLWATSAALVTGVAGGIKAVTLAMMANPVGLLIGGLALGVTAAFMFRDKIKDAIGVDVVEVFRDGANTIIGAMVGAVDASKAAFEVFPDFMAGLGARAWNSFLEGFEGSAVSWTNPFTGETFDLLNINLSTFKKDVGGAGGAAMDAVSQAFQKAQGVDYVGAIASSLGEVWENASGAGDAIGALADQAGGAAGSMGGLSKEAQKQADAYAKIVRGAHEFIAAQNLEQQALGMTAEAAARMRYEQDLLNKAANDNIKLTPTMRNELMGLAAQMAATEEATRRVTEIYNFGKDVFGSFFSDMKSGLREGKNFWEALGNAGANALDKIADRALSMAADGLWNMIFGAFTGGLGGMSGSWGVAGGFGRQGIFGLPSFDGGGDTGNGPRSGGLDGKGGFLAVMHPQETVRDRTTAANQNSSEGGRTVIEVRLSPELLAQVLQEAAGQSAQITRGMVAPVSRAVDQMAQQQRYA